MADKIPSGYGILAQSSQNHCPRISFISRVLTIGGYVEKEFVGILYNVFKHSYFARWADPGRNFFTPYFK